MPTTRPDSRLGKLIRMGRMEIVNPDGSKGLTQKELGKRVGTNQSSVSAWEGGTVKPKLVPLLALCRVLELDPRALIDAAQDDFKTEIDELTNPKPKKRAARKAPAKKAAKRRSAA